MEEFHRSAAMAAEAAATRPSGAAAPTAGADSSQAAADPLRVAHLRGYEVRGEKPPEASRCCVTRDPDAPSQVIVSQDGVVQRINLIITVSDCCDNAHTGLFDKVPLELADFMAQPEVQRYMQELHSIGELRMAGCCACLRCLVLMWIPCYWPQMGRTRDATLIRWSNALLDWQQRFNAEVLQPRGMLVKTQSHCFCTYGGKGGKQRHIQRWLAFAMNPSEAARLANEPHMTGDIEPAIGCAGQGEEGLAIHP
jgi:hypothetical protein